MFLYMFPLWGNGSGAWLRQLIPPLLAHNHTVALVSPEKRKIAGVTQYVVNPPQIGIFVGNPELKKAKKYEEMSGVEIGQIYTSYVNTALAAVKEFEPEIIHVFHTAFLPSVARIIKVLYGIRYIITTHGSDLSYLEKDRRLIGLIKDANNVSAMITANSNFTRKWYLRMFGRQLIHKIRTISGGVNLSDFKKDESLIEKINQAYNLHGKKVVLFTGRLTINKGVKYLIKAAPKIKGEILILGDGPERQHLEQLIKDTNVKNVKILGYMKPNKQGYFHAFYERADVYVIPSVWQEPLALVILESMAAGTPVIATKKGGISSLVKDGINGHLIRARNSKELAEKVNYLLENDELRKKMGAKAQEMVKEKYSWEKIAGEFEKIYEKFKFSSKEYLKIVKGFPK